MQLVLGKVIMVARRGTRFRSKRWGNCQISMDIQKPDHRSSIRWHAAFGLLIPVLLVVLQLHCLGSSPFHTHPASMLTSLLSIIIYCIAVGYYIHYQTAGIISYLKLSAEVALISGSLASTALISVLFEPSFEPIIFVVYFILLFIYLARNLILSVAKWVYLLCKTLVSQVAKTNTWKTITGTGRKDDGGEISVIVL